MSKLENIADFALGHSYAELSEADRSRFKLHVLDTVGCAIGALAGEPVARARRVLDELGGRGQSTLIGGGRSSLPHVAFYNGALVRYLDYMDAYLAEAGECHPSDNFASLLAAAEYASRSGSDLLGALAVSYQIIGALSRDTKVMKQGFDHTTTLTFSIAAGVAKLLGLDREQMINALAIAGADAAGPMASRTEPISQWKGLAAAECAYRTTFCVLLARQGVTGPRELFEGPGGIETMTRDPWNIDWSAEKLDVISRVMVKKYNGEARSQSALEATLELRAEHHLRGEDVAAVHIDTFRPGYDNLGGGKYGDKDEVHNKEQADHNLRYMAAVALLDGEVGPAQYAPGRLMRADVQSLMGHVTVEPKLTYTWRDPDEQPTRVRITLRDGRTVEREKRDFEGFPTRPMSWERAVEKFDRLAAPFTDEHLRRDLIAAVDQLEAIESSDLARLLGRVRNDAQRPVH